jgi:hypothetical protein
MSDDKPLKPIGEKIVIHKANDNKGNNVPDLHRCFFLPSEIKGFYNFYNEHGETLATGVSSNNTFPFLLDGLAWEIYDFEIDDLEAGGKFRNNREKHPDLPDEQDGSFQATSTGGGGLDELDLAVVADPPDGAIVIKTVSGDADKDKLKKCYFLANGSTYDLYSKNDNLLASGLTSGNDFIFTHDSITWTITDFVISSTAASGNWSNPDSIAPDGIAIEQDGSFQATSTGQLGEPAASVATA